LDKRGVEVHSLSVLLVIAMKDLPLIEVSAEGIKGQAKITFTPMNGLEIDYEDSKL